MLCCTDTAYCRNVNNNRWYKYDDHEVYEMNKSDVQVCYINRMKYMQLHQIHVLEILQIFIIGCTFVKLLFYYKEHMFLIILHILAVSVAIIIFFLMRLIPPFKNFSFCPLYQVCNLLVKAKKTLAINSIIKMLNNAVKALTILLVLCLTVGLLRK